MSTTLDQRVVSLQFDNKQFERNTATTMSTLDKLKEKLTFNKASKGLEDVGIAAKNINMTGLGSGVEAVTAKFSALQVMGVTALANITNSAVNAGKRMVKALTIDPITTGFKEYETQINATQTILANTKSKGSTIDDVNKALEELNKYADKTIYNFTEMTRNIGTFTAAGVDLETSVNAIQGIANLAAVSGSTSQQASTAMYQLSQALSSGTVKLQDWNSVVNAGMGGEMFQNALKETSKELETGAAKAIKARGSFRESLRDGWLTAEVLTTTLKKFTTSGANEYVAKYIGQTPEFVEGELQKARATAEASDATDKEAYAIELAAKAMSNGSKKREKQIKEALEFARTAEDAATKVKTFTQLWDVLKEAAQSGWGQTWKLIVGDFEAAKKLLTPLADTLTGFINRMSDWRNFIVQAAMDFAKPWKTIMDKLDKAGFTKIADAVSNVTDKVEYFQKVVDKVWRGDFNNWGDNPDRRDLLKAAGYDHRVVQYLVNLGEEAHKAGKTYKITAEDVAKAHKKYGVALEDTAKAGEKTTDVMANLTDEQLKNAGLTEDEIKLYRELAEEAKRSGKSIADLAKDLSEVDGRTTLIESFKNIGKTLLEVFGALKKAWMEVFPPVSIIGILNAIKAFNEFTKSILDFTKKHSEQLTSAFKGVVTIVKIAGLLFGGPLVAAIKICFNVVKSLSSSVGGLVLDVSDAIIKFSDWLESIIDIDAAVEFLTPIIVSAVKAVVDWVKELKESEKVQAFFASACDLLKTAFKSIGPAVKFVAKILGGLFDLLRESKILDWFLGALGTLADFVSRAINAFKNSEHIQKFINTLSNAKNGISDWIASLKSSESLPGDIIKGIASGLVKGIPLAVGAILDVLRAIIQAIRDEWDWHSPPGKFVQLGKDVITGILEGLRELAPILWNGIKDIFANIPDFIKDIKFSDVAATIIAGLMASGVWKLIDIVKNFAGSINGFVNTFSGIGKSISGMFDSVTNTIKDVGKAIKNNIKAKSFKVIAQSVLMFAASIAILALSIALLTKLDPAKMWGAIGAIAVLTGIVVGLAYVLTSLDKINGESKTIGKQIGLLLSITAAILLLSIAFKTLAKIDSDKVPGVLALFGGIIVGLIAMVGLLGLLSKSNLMGGIDKAGKSLILMAAALMIMIFVIKIASKLDSSTVVKAVGVIAAVGALFVGMIAASKLAGENAVKAGASLLLMSVAFGIMIAVVALAAKIPKEDVNKGVGVLAAVSVLFVGMIAVSNLAGQNGVKCGAMLLMMAGAFVVMAGVLFLLTKVPDEGVARGLGIIAALGGIFTALIAVSNLAGKHAMQCGVMLLLMSASILILTGVLFILSRIKNYDGIWRALGVIAALETLFAGLIAVTHFAKDCWKTLIVLGAVVALLAVSLVGLSFLDPKKLGVAAGALSAVLSVFAILVYVTRYLKKVNFKKILGPMAILVGVVGLLALILTLMSNNLKNPDAAIPAAIALGVLLTVMVGVIALLSVISKIGAKDVLKGVGLLTLLIVPLAGFAIILSAISKVDNALHAVQTLILLVGAMTLLLFPLALIGVIAMPALYGIAVMAVLVAAIFAMTTGLGALVSTVPGMQQFVDTGIAVLIQLATGIGDMIAAFTTSVSEAGLLKVLGVFLMMPLLVFGIATLLPLMLTIGAVAVGIGSMMNTLPGFQVFLETGMPVILQLADAIAQMIAAFTTTVSAAGLLEVLAVFAMMPLLTVGMSLLLPLMVAIGSIAAVIGKIQDWIPRLEEFLTAGLPILILLAGGIGEMVGAFVGGIITEVASTLPQLGMMLGMFMINATPFIIGAKMIDEKVLAGVGILAAAVIALTAADLIAGVSSLLQGGFSFVKLGAELSAFMLAAIPFILGASLISEDMMTGVKMLAETILILTAANVIEGLTSWLTGGSSLENFAKQLPELGKGLAAFSSSLGAFAEEQLATVKCAAEAVKTLSSAAAEIPNSGGLLASLVGENDLGVFAGQFPFLGRGLRGFLDNVGTFTDEQVTTVDCAASAIKSLAAAAAEIPNSGGWIGAILGENDLGTFAEQFPALGTGLRGFLDNVGTFTEDQVTTVDCAASAIKSLASAASEIPNEGGWIGKIVGENNLGTFAESFPALGTGLAGFLENAGTFGDDQVSTVDCAANAIKSLAAAASEIPNEGGWISKIVGDNNLSTFASNFPSLGEGIKGFVDKLGVFTSEKVTTVYAGINAVKALTGLANVDLDAAKKNISGFGKKLPDFAENLSSFCTSMPSSDSVTTAVENIDKLLDSTKKIGEANSGVLKDFASNLKKVGKDAVKKFVGAFTSDSAKKDLKSAATTLAGKAPDGAKEKKSAMMLAGNDLGNGLINGLNAKQTAVYNAGYALGQKAVQGEKDGQQSKSPSKLTIKAGKWLGEGLVIGIDKMGRAVYNSGYALGESAVKSTSSAISRIADAINTDIDAQPTIRPIMDLSDVRAGANTIGNLLNTESSIGVVANAGRIGGMMNRYSQNRGNEDIISELSKLRSEIGNMGNTSYNINGITYDDGSNVRTAVETLVRAARIERRT